jgi:regulatory subunit for Cdc7p protein kinase
MAAVSLSPTPIPPPSLPIMSTRRAPLSSNQNVANSPLRPSAAASAANPVKTKRSLAQLQREEAYVSQQPPAKKQMLDNSASQPRVNKTQVVLQQRRANGSGYESRLARERAGQYHHSHPQQQPQESQHGDSTAKYTERDLEEIRTWQKHHRARFPKMVFFFDHLPEDVRPKLAKQVTILGAVSKPTVAA